MKNSIALFLMLVVMCLTLHAQKGLEQVGVHFSISNFKNTEPIYPASLSGDGIVQVSPGVDYQHFFKDRLAVFTALGFAIFTERSENNDLRWPSEHDGMGGWTPNPSLPHQSETKTSYFFLDWQLGLKYIAIQRKLSVFIMPYFESNFLVDHQSRQKLTYDDGHTESIPTSDFDRYDGLRKTNFSVGFGVGVQYPIAPRLCFYLMPQVEYMLRSATIDGYGKFVNYGGRVGLWYEF